MDFFIPFLFPNFGNVFFFIPFSFPNYGNGFFSFPSHSQIVGMDFADSVQTEYCSTFHFPCVRPFVTGVTSYISHIYKGINAMLIIRGPIKPPIF